MKYESSILKRLIDVYGVVGNPRYISEIIKQFIVQGKECYPNLFTYQSDWLAHIDEFGLTPEYTVSYTGQQIYAPHTKERPVKRAILTGQTLVNLIDETRNYKGTVNGYSRIAFSRYELPTNKTYTFIFKNLSDVDIVVYSNEEIFTTNHQITIKVNETKQFIATIKNDLSDVTTDKTTVLKFNPTLGTANLLFECLLLEGDYTNQDIPYFEGMQSVKLPVLKTTGKNLFDNNNAEIFNGYGNGANIISNNNRRSVIFKVNGGCTYTVQKTLTNRFAIDCSILKPKNDVPVKRLFNENTQTKATITVPYGYNYIIIYYASLDEGDALDTVAVTQIEEGSTATSYEPYKSNILTVNEDVTLCGIGDVEDT